MIYPFRCYASAGVVHRYSKWCMSENRDRFLSDTRYRGPTVHLLREIDGVCTAHESCAAHTSTAVSIRQRAEKQEVQQVNVQRSRLLADDGLDDQQPHSRRPCFAAAAMCSAVIKLTCMKPTALGSQHQSMLTSCSPCPLNIILARSFSAHQSTCRE